MNPITLTGLDPHQLAALENHILGQLEQRSAEVGQLNIAAGTDQGGWYQLAMTAAAAIVALEFRLARGE